MKQSSKDASRERLHAIKLSPRSIQIWQKCLLARARLKGVPAKLPIDLKLKELLKQEQNNLRQLWETFTTERSNLQRYLLDQRKQTVAYLLGFHLPNQARMQAVVKRAWKRLPHGLKLEDDATLRILDLGCGSGSMTLGFLESLGPLRPKNVEVVLVDNKKIFLDVAKELILDHFPETRVRCIRSEIKDLRLDSLLDEPSENTTDVMLLGYLWNELSKFKPAQAKLLEIARRLSSQSSLVIALEPANQSIAREAMALRETLKDQSYQVLYPCPSSQSCPMLERQRDWCYSELSWQRTKFIEDVDKRLGIERTQLSAAAFVFTSEKLKAKISQPDKLPEPIVGRPVVKNQKIYEYLVCEGDKIRKQASKKDRAQLPRGTTGNFSTENS